MYKIQTVSDLANLVGKLVEFTEGIDDYESFAEVGMKARVVKYVFDQYEDGANHPDVIHNIWFDFGEFDAENHKFFQANYYDKNGNPCLTAKEAGYYQPVESIYFGREAPFKVPSDA